MFQDGLLKGKRILVTGGGTGLGKEMADEFGRLGAEVYICGRRGSVLEETAKELSDKNGVPVHTRELDIRVAAAVDEVVQSIFDEGPLDGLVNNAAGNFIARTKDLSPRGFDAIANIVFHGTFYVTQAVGKRWIDAGHKGSVVNILTTWVWNGSPYVVPSAMSKTGIKAMTESLAVEWGPYGIRLNSICPGLFPTEGMSKRLNPGKDWENQGELDGNPMGRPGEMQELRNLATFLMAPGVEYMSGQTIAIDGAQYFATGGNFSNLAKLTDDDWEAIRNMIKSTNDQDKSKRST